MLSCTVRTSTSSSRPFDRHRTGRTSSGQGPSDFAFRTVGHRFAARSWARSKAFTRLRQAGHSNSTVGAPSGAMLFCTFRNSTSSSRPFDRLRTGRTSSGPGPSALALASLRASLRGARCGHLVPSFHSPSASESFASTPRVRRAAIQNSATSRKVPACVGTTGFGGPGTSHSARLRTIPDGNPGRSRRAGNFNSDRQARTAPRAGSPG